jgi:hypothetical protein
MSNNTPDDSSGATGYAPPAPPADNDSDYDDDNTEWFVIDDEPADNRGLIDYRTVAGRCPDPPRSTPPSKDVILTRKHVATMCEKCHIALPECLDDIVNKINSEVLRLIDTTLVVYDERNGKVLKPQDIKHAIYLLHGQTLFY